MSDCMCSKMSFYYSGLLTSSAMLSSSSKLKKQNVDLRYIIVNIFRSSYVLSNSLHKNITIIDIRN